MSPSSSNSDALDSVRGSLNWGMPAFMTVQLLDSYDKSMLGHIQKTAFANQLFALKLPKEAAAFLIAQCRGIMAQNPQKNIACLKLIEVCEEVIRVASHLLPRGIEFSPMTRGLLEVFYKTKLGQMEETEFARRLAVLNKLSPNIVHKLICQGRTLMEQDPKEKAACLQIIEACEHMVCIAKSPHVPRTNLLEFPLDIRNEIYDMVIGHRGILVHECSNATQKYVTCPTGSCRAAPNGDICSEDRKDIIVLAQTCQQVRSEFLEVLYRSSVLYFSCTCALALCLGKNKFVRKHVQAIRLHLRGDRTDAAVSILPSCLKLKRLEVTVSKDTKVYHSEDDHNWDPTLPRQRDGFIIRKLEEVRGVSGLLELGEMVEIEAKHAPGVVAVHPSELERLNTILKAGFAGVAARAAELARAREKEATMSLRWQLSRANSEWANALRRRGESKPSL